MTTGGTLLRMMLILSAIDLLSSALTAGVVLFVILVGGDAGRGEASTQSGTGLNILELIDPSGQISVFNQSPRGTLEGPPTGLEAPFFVGKVSLVHRRYLVPTTTKKLVFLSAGGAFAFAVRPVVGERYKIFVDCALEGGRLEIAIAPLSLSDCTPKRSSGGVSLQKGSALLLPIGKTLPNLSALETQSPGFSKFELSSAVQLPVGLSIWGLIE